MLAGMQAVPHVRMRCAPQLWARQQSHWASRTALQVHAGAGRCGSWGSRGAGAACGAGLLVGASLGAAGSYSGPRRHRAGFTTAAVASSCDDLHPVTGAPPGPYPVGVTTMQLDDTSRTDPEGGPRRLQTEIWYPAGDEARGLPANRYSDFLARGVLPEYIARAEDPDAIGGYRPGLTIAELDGTWQNLARRDARPRDASEGKRWPVVIFSHGQGAFRASYVYFTEYLASQGFVVVACDHAGSSRYTILDGEVVKGGGRRGEVSHEDRPKDVRFLLDTLERMHLGSDSRFAGRLDLSRCAVAGMSFGGWTTAKVLDSGDPRVKAAILQCPSLAARGGLKQQISIPTMIMLGTEDTVIGERGNSACREYFDGNLQGPRYSVELRKGGHVTFTSCEQYSATYGNGIGTSKSLTDPGTTYEPLPPPQSHAIVNKYAAAFLDVHLNGNETQRSYLEQNHFGEEVIYRWKH